MLHQTSDYLFKVCEEGIKLNEDLAQEFHHTVYQLLFATSIARHNIQTVVLFLTMQVKDPDKDDWEKQVRVLKYLNRTWFMKLILSADKMNFIIHCVTLMDLIRFMKIAKGRLDVS